MFIRISRAFSRFSNISRRLWACISSFFVWKSGVKGEDRYLEHLSNRILRFGFRMGKIFRCLGVFWIFLFFLGRVNFLKEMLNFGVWFGILLILIFKIGFELRLFLRVWVLRGFKRLRFVLILLLIGVLLIEAKGRKLRIYFGLWLP